MLVDDGGALMHDLDAQETTASRRPAEPGAGPSERRASQTAGASGGAAAILNLQRTVGNAGVVQMLSDESDENGSPVHDVVGRGGGTGLDPSTRATMESRFGADFSDVRVHTDARASQSAESVGANAYTVGNDVVFRSGHFDPGSPTGQRTLAHELSHVLQQRSGPVDGTEAPGGIRLSDPGDRFERAADQTADAVLAGSLSGPEPAAGGTSAPNVQMESDAEDGQAFVQRQEAEAMEEEEEEEA
jgi:hypothetical protein